MIYKAGRMPRSRSVSERVSRYNGGNPPTGISFGDAPRTVVVHGGNPQDHTTSPQRASLRTTNLNTRDAPDKGTKGQIFSHYPITPSLFNDPNFNTF